jgi:hypothetical protein
VNRGPTWYNIITFEIKVENSYYTILMTRLHTLLRRDRYSIYTGLIFSIHTDSIYLSLWLQTRVTKRTFQT